jgi:uncharacterized membrane protein
MYGETNSYSFSVRCVFNKNPFIAVLIMLVSSILFFTINIRMYEQVFDNEKRIQSINTNLGIGGLNFESWNNSIWCTFITMMTGNIL